VLEKGLHTLEQLDAHARNAVGQRAQARGEHGAGRFGIQQLDQAAAVEGEQVLRQRLDLRQRHRHHAGVAVAGGHTVDHPFAVEQGIEELGAAGNALAKAVVGLQACRCAAFGHGQHVLDAQMVLAKDHGFRCGVVHVRSRKGRS